MSTVYNCLIHTHTYRLPSLQKKKNQNFIWYLFRKLFLMQARQVNDQVCALVFKNSQYWASVISVVLLCRDNQGTQHGYLYCFALLPFRQEVNACFEVLDGSAIYSNSLLCGFRWSDDETDPDSSVTNRHDKWAHTQTVSQVKHHHPRMIKLVTFFV